MSEREELAARALWFAGRDGQEWLPGEDPLCDLIAAEAKAALAAADAPILALIEEAENRRGSSMYCKVTTRELRKALGLKVAGDEWTAEEHVRGETPKELF